MFLKNFLYPALCYTRLITLNVLPTPAKEPKSIVCIAKWSIRKIFSPTSSANNVYS